MNKFNQNQRVLHKRYGPGRVLKVFNSKNNIEYLFEAFNDIPGLARNQAMVPESKLERARW